MSRFPHGIHHEQDFHMESTMSRFSQGLHHVQICTIHLRVAVHSQPNAPSHRTAPHRTAPHRLHRTAHFYTIVAHTILLLRSSRIFPASNFSTVGGACLMQTSKLLRRSPGLLAKCGYIMADIAEAD